MGWVQELGQGRVLAWPHRWVLGLAFTASGACALVAQVTWQRVIALHAGVDLESSATVVAAFLAGLGVGNLLGGRLADRLGRRGALVALAAASLGFAAYAWVSTWLLYDLYRSLADLVDPLPLRLGFNVVLLLAPATLSGLGLPLVARIVATDVAGAGSSVGRFNAANTFGAALGALVATWLLLGQFGFVGSVRLAAAGEVVAALAYLALALVPAQRSEVGRAVGTAATFAAVAGTVHVGRGLLDEVAFVQPYEGLLVGALALVVGAAAYVLLVAQVPPARDLAPTVPSAPTGGGTVGLGSAWSPRTWYLVYGATGALALGFEVTMFRLVGGVMRSNTYTFGHVLGLYLALLALGGLVGAWARPRVADDRGAFLLLQAAVGAFAALGLFVLVSVLPHTSLAPTLEQWYSADGFASGFGRPRQELALFGVGLPLLLLGPSVLAMGAAFPFAHGLVSRDLEHVGVRTGRLVAANIAGNVVGTVVFSFGVIQVVGTAGSLRVVVLGLGVAGVVAALGREGRRKKVATCGVVVVLVLAVVAVPSNQRTWAALASPNARRVLVAEDRTCSSMLEHSGGRNYQLDINATSQNGYPFDDFHLLIGLLPALVHPHPRRALAVGLGIGSTSYGMLASERAQRVTTVELCGGNYALVDRLARRNIPEFERLARDPAHREVVDDGRRHLLTTDERFDLVVPDALRPNAPGAGNLYSREFQELVRDRLAPGGLVAGWYPTYRALNAVTTTYPYVVGLEVGSYSGSPFYLASKRPITFDRAALLERFDALPEGAMAPEQRADLRRFIEEAAITCFNDGRVAQVASADDENRDLFPRDEYPLAHGGIDESRIARTCHGTRRAGE